MKTIALMMMTISIAACAAKTQVADGPSMNARRYSRLQELAARDLSCDVGQLAHEYEGENMHRMSGCGTDGLYELRCLMGNCVWIQDVRKRAEFDLACARTELAVQKIGPNSSGVAGCGKRATYLLGPSGDWILSKNLRDGNVRRSRVLFG